GPGLKRFLVRMIPLPESETALLLTEFRSVSVGIFLGIGVVGLFQGVTAGIAFALFGVPRAVVWATLTMVASLLPAVGTGLVCVPVGVYQIVTGHVASGCAVLVFWGVVVVFVADYVLRPWLLRGRMKLHSLLVFVALFGGIEAFGVIGLALGP